MVAALLCSFTYAARSFAHVALDSPPSGSTLAVGSTVTITWEDTILHEGIGYDLDLVGADEYIQSPIVRDLPTNVHSYDWLVPDIWCVGCYVMVTQVNRGQDYEDSALVNIYGTPAAAGSGGTGGSGGSPNESHGGASGIPAGGSGGMASSHASAGASGNLPMSSSSAGAGSSVTPGSNPASSGGSTSRNDSEEGSTTSAAGASAEAEAEAEGGSSGAANAAAGEPDDAASDVTAGSLNSGSCAIDFRAPSRFGFSLCAAVLSFVLVTRKRRSARRHA